MLRKIRMNAFMSGFILVLMSLAVFGFILFTNLSIPEYRESMADGVYYKGPYDIFIIIALPFLVVGCAKIFVNLSSITKSIKLSGLSEKELEDELHSSEKFNNIYIGKNNVYFMTDRFFKTIPYSVIKEIRLETRCQSAPVTSEELTEINSKTNVRFETGLHADDKPDGTSCYQLIFVRPDQKKNDMVSSPDKAKQLATINAILDIKNDIPVTIV